MNIEALLFDLGKVLIDFNFEPGVQALHACCSLPLNDFHSVLFDKAWIRRYERGEISTAEFHAYLCENAKLTMELADFRRTWSSVFLPDMIVSEALLAALKQRYPLILVSNTNEAHIEFIRNHYGVLEYFDNHIFSYEVGSLKPDAKIFECAIAASGLPAEALFFTDDRDENIVGAARLGITAHKFVSELRLIEALKEAGVELGTFVNS